MPTGTWQLGRRAFLAVAGASMLGTLAAGRALGQSDSPGTGADFPPPTSVDPIGDLAFALDADVDRIFRFVADEVRYEPYAGALRGAKGTLASRAGNSVDQALLLAALLEAAGVRARFATGAIDEPTAATLLGTSVTPAEDARMDVAARLLGPRDQAPTASPDPSVAAQLNRPGSTPSDVDAWLTTQIDGTVATLTGALADAGITLPGAFTPVPMLERDQHVWVQAANGAGWLDLDPSLPGQPSGQGPTTANQMMDTLPDDAWHNVELAVVAETVSGGVLVQARLMSLASPAAEIADAPISYVTVTPEGMQAAGSAVGGGLDGWKTYVPILIVGEDGYHGAPFRLSTGETLFSGGGPAPDGETTGVWLQVTITAPDTEPIVVRRPVFDRVGGAARGSGPFDPSQLVRIKFESLGPDLPLEYPPARTSHWLTVTTGTPTFARFSTDVTRPDMRHPAGFAQAYQFIRELTAAAMGIDRGVRIFQNGPNVAAVSLDGQTGTNLDQASGLVADIWHRSFGQSALVDVDVSVPPALLAGVISHAAERLPHVSPRTSSDGSSPVEVSVGAVFDAAAAAGIPLRVLTSATLPGELSLPADVAVRLGRRLAEGWLAVVPERAVSLGAAERTGWWLVDSVTGATIDEMDDGRGEFTERTVQAQYIIINANLAAKIACAVTVAGLAVVAAFGYNAVSAWVDAYNEGVKGGQVILLAALAWATAASSTGYFAAAYTCGAL